LFGTTFSKSQAFQEPPGRKKKELDFADREVRVRVKDVANLS